MTIKPPNKTGPTTSVVAEQNATGTEEPLGRYGYEPREATQPEESTADGLRANAGTIAVGLGLTALALSPNANIVNVDDPAANKVDPEQYRQEILGEANHSQLLESGQVYDQMAQENTIAIPQAGTDQNGLGPNNN